MNARSTRGPGGGRVGGRRPPTRGARARRPTESGCAVVALLAFLAPWLVFLLYVRHAISGRRPA